MVSYIFIFVLCIYINKIVKKCANNTQEETCCYLCKGMLSQYNTTLNLLFQMLFITRHSHQTELKLSINENANSAPSTPPMAAVCVEIFHHTLIMAQSICITNATISIDVINVADAIGS